MARETLLQAQGTLYPLLGRLRKRGLVSTHWEESPTGPPRRYYAATDLGHETIATFRSVWKPFSEDVGEILDELGPVEAIAADVDHDPLPGDVREATPTSRWWLLLGSAALSLVLLPLVPFLALPLALATAIASMIARGATAERPWHIGAAMAISTVTLMLGMIGGLFLVPSPTGGSPTDLPAAPAATE